MPPRLIFLPGLNGDPRIFRELIRHFPTAEVVEWLAPLRHESIPSYAARIAEPLGNLQDAVLVGVSFGGIIAQEIATHHRAKACVIISSVRTPKELPPYYQIGRVAAYLPIENLIATASTTATLLPSSSHSRAIRQLGTLKGKRSAWRRWAIAAVLRWKPQPRDDLPILHIHGDQDTTFPIRYLHPDLTIPGGGHLIALTHAKVVADVIATSIE